jgi:hypothetical protein
MTEAVSTSETSVNFYETTRRNIPEDIRHTGRGEDIKYDTTQAFLFPLHCRRKRRTFVTF